jgi:hypothetical protein
MKEYKENAVESKKAGKRFGVAEKASVELSDNLTKEENLRTTSLLKSLFDKKMFG